MCKVGLLYLTACTQSSGTASAAGRIDRSASMTQMNGTVAAVVLGPYIGLAVMLGADAEDHRQERGTSLGSQTEAARAGSMTDEQLLEWARRFGLEERQFIFFLEDDAAMSPEARFKRAVLTEIRRRGSSLEPALIQLVLREAPQQTTQEGSRHVRWAMCKLASIRSTHSAAALLKVLEGGDGGICEAVRRYALHSLECLTYHRFRPTAIEHGCGYEAIEHQGMVPANGDLGRIADFYEIWLAGEGKAPQEWFGRARARARAMLQSRDPRQVYLGAKFLSKCDYHSGARHRRDDQPGRTLARVIEVLRQLEPDGDGYAWRGTKLPGRRGHWIFLATRHGPRARPYSALLMKLETEYGRDRMCRSTSAVGGEVLMAYYFDSLPRLSTKDALGGCRYAIGRWAGRLFSNDDERIRWWQENKDKTQEQWLRESLPVLVRQAARPGLPGLVASSTAATILPDLPMKRTKADGYGNPRADDPVGWLRLNRSRLRYDEQAGAFRLAPPGE